MYSSEICGEKSSDYCLNRSKKLINCYNEADKVKMTVQDNFFQKKEEEANRAVLEM